MPGQPEIVVLADKTAMAHQAAERIYKLATQRIAEQGSFLLALAGGSTPRLLYERLAKQPLSNQIPWEHVRVLWGDERYVPHDDEASNYRMAKETLLDHVPLLPDQIYPIPTHSPDPREAAAVYHTQVQTLLAAHQGQIDLVLLGMGEDGHVASLFPNHPALTAPDDSFAVAVDNAPVLPPQRISLTFAAINSARQVIFLVSGASKSAMLHTVLHSPLETDALPAQRVSRSAGSVTWIVDQAAMEH